LFIAAPRPWGYCWPSPFWRPRAGWAAGSQHQKAAS